MLVIPAVIHVQKRKENFPHGFLSYPTPLVLICSQPTGGQPLCGTVASHHPMELHTLPEIDQNPQMPPRRAKANPKQNPPK